MQYRDSDVLVKKWWIVHLPTGLAVDIREHVTQQSAWDEFRYRVERAAQPEFQPTT